MWFLFVCLFFKRASSLSLVLKALSYDAIYNEQGLGKRKFEQKLINFIKPKQIKQNINKQIEEFDVVSRIDLLLDNINPSFFVNCLFNHAIKPSKINPYYFLTMKIKFYKKQFLLLLLNLFQKNKRKPFSIKRQ